MAKGDKLKSEPKIYKDEKTGREVWRMTSWDRANCVATYFYSRAFSGDERYIIFTSDRAGKFELYRLEIENGETIQLTDNFSQRNLLSFNVHPDGREVFYHGENAIYAVDIESGEERPVADLSDKPWGSIYGGPSISGDGKKVVCQYKHKKGGAGIAMAETKGSSFEDLYKCDKLLSHVQINPGDNPIISFNILPDQQNIPDLPPHERARAWKLDLNTGETVPFLVMPPGFRATHEYWSPKGGRLYFHKKTVPTWTPTSIASISVDGDDFREHFISETRKLGHSCIDPHGRIIVSDVQEPHTNELIAIDLDTGASEVLCWPNSSVGNGQLGHVHPSSSFSGKKVLYTSDVTGKAQVYMVSL